MIFEKSTTVAFEEWSQGVPCHCTQQALMNSRVTLPVLNQLYCYIITWPCNNVKVNTTTLQEDLTWKIEPNPSFLCEPWKWSTCQRQGQ